MKKATISLHIPGRKKKKKLKQNRKKIQQQRTVTMDTGGKSRIYFQNLFDSTISYTTTPH